MPVTPDPKVIKDASPSPGPMPLVVFFLMGTLFGISLCYSPKPKPTAPSVNPVTAEQLDRIHDSIVQLQASKCFNVTTPSITIYHTPNLGVSPVPAYDKSARKGKLDVQAVQRASGPEGANGG